MMTGQWLLRRISTTGAQIARWSGRFCAGSVDELPEEMDPQTIYVVGENGHRWFAAFLCPCDCRETIHASLVERSRPHWRLIERWNGTGSLHPSVRRTKGCRSHFWVRKVACDGVE